MDNHHKSPPPLLIAAASSTGNSTTNRALENFKQLLLECAIASTPTQSLSDPHTMFIKQRIQQLLPEFPTPFHPPYSSMIENAIKQMNMESGSSEEEISKFISEEYKGLPLAHSTLVEHHLGKLCECGELVRSVDGLYLFGKETSESKPDSSVATPSSSFVGDSNLEYESTSTSSSTDMQRKRKTRSRKRKKNKMGKQKVTSRGKGRVKSLGWVCEENIIDRENDAIVGQEESNVSMDDTTEIANLVVEHEVASENIQKQSHDPFNVQSHIEHSTIVKEIESSGQEEMMNDTSSRPSTSEQGQLMKDLQMVETGKSTEPVEAATDIEKDRLVIDEERQTRKSPGSCPNLGAMRIDDDNMVPERLTSDIPPAFERNMMDEDIMDELIDEVYMEITQETQHLNSTGEVVEQISPEEQNRAEGNDLVVRIIQLSESENENEDDGIKRHTQLIQLSESDNEDDGVKGHSQLTQLSRSENEDDGIKVHRRYIQLSESENEEDGVKGHTHTPELQDGINEKILANQTSEIGNICLDEQQQIEPTMDLNEPHTQVEIIGHRNLCKENCPIIEEENYIKYASEVLDEQGQHIKLPESMTEQNQHEELDCILNDAEKNDNKESENFDELKEPDNETIEMKKQPYTEHSEGQSQHLEEPNQQVLRSELDQQAESSNGMGGEILSSEKCYIEQKENNSQQSEEQNQEVERNRQIELSKVKSVEDSSNSPFPPQLCIEQNETQSPQEEQIQEVGMIGNDQQKILPKVKSVEDSSTIHFSSHPDIEYNENHSQQLEEECQEVEISNSVEDSSTMHFPPQPNIEQQENQSQQLEEQNQNVDTTGTDQSGNDQQRKLSEEMGAEIFSQETTSKVKSVENSSIVYYLTPLENTTDNPYCQKLRPRPTKFLLDQEEEPKTPSVQKSNNPKKPKSQPSKSESVEDSKRKQEGQTPRRSLRLQSAGRGI